MATSTTLKTALLSCIEGISNKNVEAVIKHTDPLVLFEIPMLKPDRLHGHSEIRRGFESAFKSLQLLSLLWTMSLQNRIRLQLQRAHCRLPALLLQMKNIPSA